MKAADGRGARPSGDNHFSHFGAGREPARRAGEDLPRLWRDRHGPVRAIYVHDANEEAERYGVPAGHVHRLAGARPRLRPAVLRGPARRRGDRQGQRRPLRRPQDRRRAGRSISNGSRSSIATARRAATRPRRSPTPSCAACPTTCIYICPQFTETDINFQRVPTVDTSNPFIARWIPTPDEFDGRDPLHAIRAASTSPIS